MRDIRGGKLNDPNFESRMRGEGIFAEEMAALFQLGAQEIGDQRALAQTDDEIFSAAFKNATRPV